MGLFDKKFCDVCGDKIGLLGNRKLEDGNLCKNCAAKLSPLFTGRRHSTLADIRSQLADREANKARAAAFRRDQKLGSDGRALYLDEAQGTFAVCYESDWKGGNPDILSLSAVRSCRYDTEEHRTERKHKDANGDMVSYNPPVYDYSYDYYIVIDVDHPYIDEIRFRVNNMTLSRSGGSILTGGDRRIMECEELCRKIVDLLSGRSASQSDLELDIRQIVSPFRTKDPNGAYDMVAQLSVTGSAGVRVIDAEKCNEKMAVEIIRAAISKGIIELEREGIEIHAVDAGLLGAKLTSVLGSSSLRPFGLELTGANLVPAIDPASEQMMQRMIAARAQVGAVNTAPAAPAAPVSPEWVCPACTAKNDGGRFCVYCGTPRP